MGMDFRLLYGVFESWLAACLVGLITKYQNFKLKISELLAQIIDMIGPVIELWARDIIIIN